MSSASIDSAFDSRLVAQIAAGDAKAVGKLFDRYAGLVYNLTSQVLQDAARAEQAVFELFLRLWHDADRLDSAHPEIKTRLLQNAYALAKAQLPADAGVAEHWENLTDAELEETLLKDPAPPELLDELKARLMATIEPGGGSAPVQAGRAQSQTAGQPSFSKRRTRNLWPILAFAFGIAASLLAIYSNYRADQFSKQLQELTVDLSVLRQELSVTRIQLEYTLSPETEVLTLTGQPAAPQAKGKLVWSPADGQGFFSARELPPLPIEKTYQLWVIAGGSPIPVKTFAVDSTGSAQIRFAHLPPAEQIFSFNVTLEPTGGVAEPTGEKLLSGNRL